MEKENYNKKIEELFDNLGCDMEDLLHTTVEVVRSLDKIKTIVYLRDNID